MQRFPKPIVLPDSLQENILLLCITQKKQLLGRLCKCCKCNLAWTLFVKPFTPDVHFATAMKSQLTVRWFTVWLKLEGGEGISSSLRNRFCISLNTEEFFHCNMLANTAMLMLSLLVTLDAILLAEAFNTF